MCFLAAVSVRNSCWHILQEIIRIWCPRACRCWWAAVKSENFLRHVWQEILGGQCFLPVLCWFAAWSDANSVLHFWHLKRGQWLFSFSCCSTASFCPNVLSQFSHPNCSTSLSYWLRVSVRISRGEAVARFSEGLFVSLWTPATSLAPIHAKKLSY
jgi:hypothetical protein